MSSKKPRILIVGAGMSGLTAAHKLHTTSYGTFFDVHVAEGGERIGGRIDTSVFCGDRIEMGATWIHGIQKSPVYEIAKKIGSLESGRPWECMDGSYGGPITVVENGYELDFGFVESVSKYFDVLMGFAQGNGVEEIGGKGCEMAKRGFEIEEIKPNGMNYSEMAKRVCDFEQNGVDCCEIDEKDLKFDEIEQKEMNFSEMAKRVCDFEQNGVNFCEMDEKDLKFEEIEQNRVNCCEMDKKDFKIEEIEQKGMNCCEMAKMGCEIKEIKRNGVSYCEMDKRDFKIEEIGMNCCEMAKRGCDFEQNEVNCCERDEKDFKIEEIEQKGMDCCEMAKRGCDFEQNGVNCCEVDKKDFKIEEIEQKGVNCCEMAKRGSEIKEIKRNKVSYCEMDKRDFKIEEIDQKGMNYCEMAKRAYESCVRNGGFEKISIGGFLRKGLELYIEEVKGFGDFDLESILEAVYEMKENTQRTYTSADDLETLDFKAESEYKLFPGEEITIAKGYMSVIESLASVLPDGCVKLGKKVVKIEWRSENCERLERDLGGEIRVVKVNFSDGSYMFADHVILTVSLGVLKAGVCEKSRLFDPPLPSFKIDAISRLGYGVVNKLFMEFEKRSEKKFPFLQMAFHKTDSQFRDPKVPLWMRKTNSLCPIYGNSNVVLSWFAGKEALELESLEDEEIIDGVSKTLSCFSIKSEINVSSNFGKIVKTRWGKDPLFLGSYSYVAVGSSCDDLDTLAMPLPENEKNENSFCFPFQILFAGEATHRTHYSTTHGAYFSGLREANRLLRHYGL